MIPFSLSHSARLDVAPTFYQTLAGVTHLEEQEIAELEKRFWALAQDSSSGLIDRCVICCTGTPTRSEVLWFIFM